MGRTVLLYAPTAALVAWSWLRLEDPSRPARVLAAAAIAFVPALLRAWWQRLVAALVGAALVVSGGFGLSPFHPGSYAQVFGRFQDGLLAYYDFVVPFGPDAHPRMHGVLVVAVFGFCLALGLAIAARRPVLAAVVVTAGAAWPATLVPRHNVLGLGVLVLAAVLLLFAGMRPRAGGVPRAALAVGAVMLLVGLAVSSSSAVAKGAFLGWRHWKLQTHQDAPVSVAYVWDAQYRGIHFPTKVTPVLHITATGRAVYWRATTLDDFNGAKWREAQDDGIYPPPAKHDGFAKVEGDSSYPRAARQSANWLEQRVQVDALAVDHLIGASVPVAYKTDRNDVTYSVGGVASLLGSTHRGERYTVWSYAPNPSPQRLERIRPVYPRDVAKRDLEVANDAMPVFGTPGRDAKVDALFTSGSSGLAPYRTVWLRARQLAGSSQSPYEVVTALEVWLRTAGGFRYDEQPPAPRPGVPPLADFVTRTKAGYCQHFAGAMALMLRFLGIPARVAEGFTSGTFDSKSGVWTVTDHDAHAWVEVWFQGYGWLPFDPTPGRGYLGSAYSASSRHFDPTQATQELAQTLGVSAEALRKRIAKSQRPGGARVGTKGGGAGLRGVSSDSTLRRHAPNLLLLLAAAILAGIALIGITKVLLRRVRYLTRSPRRTATACRRELEDFLRDQRIEPPPGATLAELNGLLDELLAVRGDDFVAAATAARFSPPDRAAASAREARRELRRLLRSVRTRLSATERVRGLVSLRSLGFR